MATGCRVSIFIVFLMIVAVAPGCARQTVAVNVSAGASLTDAIIEINKLYTQENPSVTITPNFAGLGTLQRQIENGAPVDIFIGAAAAPIDALQKEGLILDDTRKDLLTNKVVLVVPAESSLDIKEFKDLTSDKVRKVAIGDPKSVAAGMYAQQILDRNSIADTIKQKLVLAGDVRQVLTYVESGNVDAGVVFATDAKSSAKVKIAANAPDDINAKVIYPVAIIKGSKSIDAARDYESFLFGNKAKAVFEKYGFSVISK